MPPRTGTRTKRLRAIFLVDFNGLATADNVIQKAAENGLLEGLEASSAREIVRVALRPIATANYWQSARYRAHVPSTTPQD